MDITTTIRSKVCITSIIISYTLNTIDSRPNEQFVYNSIINEPLFWTSERVGSYYSSLEIGI